MLPILALAGLVVAGKTVARKAPTEQLEAQAPPTHKTIVLDANRSTLTNMYTGVPSDEVPVSGVQRHKKEVVRSFADIAQVTHPRGAPNANYADRIAQNVSGRMNNMAPVQQQQVGPGLGLAPDQAAGGGFQQLTRVMPDNVGAYKLTTLPGRTGPATGTLTGGARPMESALAKNRPDTTVARGVKNMVGGRAAVTGPAGRGEHVFTAQPTIRSMTTARDDNLAYGPAQRFIGSSPAGENPTRERSDEATTRLNDVKTPGIVEFRGGYENAPTDIRVAENRGRADRAGNPGRMNVRADPVNAGGALTAVRAESAVAYMNHGGTSGPYGQIGKVDTNAYKGQRDFRTDELGLAQRQLANNPYAHPLS